MSYITHTEKLFHEKKKTLGFHPVHFKAQRDESIKHIQDPVNVALMSQALSDQSGLSLKSRVGHSPLLYALLSLTYLTETS